MPTCAECGQANPDIARFCLACGASLAEPAPPSEERKLVTGVFVDVVGSTARSERLDPEDVRAMLGPYHARTRNELERFGGTVEKFIGDAVFALFGAPVAHEDDAERAVRAALAIKDAVADLNTRDHWLDLHIRIGITTGEALVMLDAKPKEGEWLAAGDIVNTAARIQSAAPPDGVLIGQLTYEATRNVIAYRDAPSVHAKGKAEPVPVWEVVGVRESPLPQRLRLPLVGRERELGRLQELWEDVRRDGRPAVATVLAPPGIGKSRLLVEVAERLADSAAVHWGRCLPYGEGITYWAVTEIVKAAAGILQSDPPRTMSAKLGALVESLPTSNRDELRTISTAVANVIGATTTPRGTYTAAEIGQAELHWGLRRLFELLASYRPLVLVFEDLHSAEATLLELLQFIARGFGPLLVLGSARPELEDESPEFLAANRLALRLDALDDESSEALLARLLEGAVLPDTTAEALIRTAGGNPLFLEEMVRMLEAAGTDDAAEIPVPTSLQSLIASRLDQLPGEEKRLVQHASVVGAVFWPGAVSHLAGATGAPEPQLDALERRDFVRAQTVSSVAGEREYAFKHILIRDVAYAQLPKGRRVDLHARFADWVTMLPGSDDEFVEIVAYHLEQSCRLAREVARSPIPPPTERAVDALTRSGEKAERREGIREADRFYQRALELVDDERAEAAIELRLRRGRTLTGLGELRRSGEQLLAVAEDALAAGRRDLRCAALVALANIDYKHGRAASARSRLDEAETIARELGDARLQIRTAYEFAQLRADLEGGGEEATADLRQALRLAEELADRPLQIEGYMRLGTILFNHCRLAEAEDEFTRAADLAGASGSHRDEARTTTQLAYVNYYRGDRDDAQRRALKAADWLERTGDTFFQLQNAVLTAMLALAEDDPQKAERRLRVALPLALESGGWILVLVYRYLAEALVAQGRVGDADELASFAERDVQPEDLFALAMVRLAQGSVAAARFDPTAARERFRAALGLLEQQRLAVFDLAEARVAFARALRRLGDEAGARRELKRARETFAEMDARALLAEIDAELAALAGGAGTAGPAAAP